ncbi:MAG TPA: stage III sporulation protein AD [Candidatus Monoglobus merdigallinarum]|uniref:Stage III sporulation protein AD n=1 Tax=Candidatus Monoglobus merdigallinarum TaxID=2838698 RepID=A0A9D1PRI2_9FIRM|nr:stage III sporulation protein AD [Candidatus Monoglobus merdigallinarum]
MEVIRIVGIGLIGGVISILLRNAKPEYSMMIPAVVSFTVLWCSLPYLDEIVGMLSALSEEAGINTEYMAAVIKIIGIAYLTSISAELCRDAGEAAIASKIELGGKLIILSLSVPIINALLSLIKQIIMYG